MIKREDRQPLPNRPRDVGPSFESYDWPEGDWRRFAAHEGRLMVRVCGGPAIWVEDKFGCPQWVGPCGFQHVRYLPCSCDAVWVCGKEIVFEGARWYRKYSSTVGAWRSIL